MKAVFQLLVVVIFLFGCKKDETPVPNCPAPHVPTKWELIPGEYKVYDTVGVFLYDMKLSYSHGFSEQGYPVDSLTFENFDGQFDFTVPQSDFSNAPTSVNMGAHNGIIDTNGNHWNIFDFGSDEQLNSYVNDTIKMYFEKHNTPYWLNDGTWYYYCKCKHIAVKQH